MNQKVCIISLRFTPTCLSKLPAWGELFHALGYEVEYVLDPKYKKFEEFAKNDAAVAATDPGWSTSRRYEHALFFHPVPTNHVHARKLSNTGCKIWYFYDEPWESLGRYLGTESFFDVFKLLVAHYFSVRMLKLSHGVILLSQRAVSTYERQDIRLNRNYFKIPLLFHDDSDGLLQQNRVYFSFIGNLVKAHGFPDFIQFVRYSILRKLDIRFLIASRHPLPEDLAKDETIANASDRVVVRCGRPLTNSEINLCYAQSICVWNLYRRSTQSGVLVTATMFGTPVLAADTGSFPEFVTDHQEGRLLRSTDPETILQAYEEIRGNLSRYTISSRQRFLNTFDYRSQLDLCRRIFLDGNNELTGSD